MTVAKLNLLLGCLFFSRITLYFLSSFFLTISEATNATTVKHPKTCLFSGFVFVIFFKCFFLANRMEKGLKIGVKNVCFDAGRL